MVVTGNLLEIDPRALQQMPDQAKSSRVYGFAASLASTASLPIN